MLPADAIFFPARPGLGLIGRQISPDLERRLVETAAYTKSFELAAKAAQTWTDRTFSGRNIGRLAEDVGAEMVTARDAEVSDFIHHRQEPSEPDPKHDLVAVLVDGGRIQMREATGTPGPGVHKHGWREDKVARLQTMKSQTFEIDPCPEPPACFLDPKKLQKLFGINENGAIPETKALVPETNATPTLDTGTDTPSTDESRWQPKPLVRTCVATMEKADRFRWMVWAESKRRHFFTAKRKAFVADGQEYNWTIRERQFSDFIPILDFMHAAGYLYGAAVVLGRQLPNPATATATIYQDWIRDAWQGRANEVLPKLEAALNDAKLGPETLPDDHAWKPLQRAATYFNNHRDKMNYPEYRRQGLPTTSSLIESQIKEFNYRMKGSEKFWNEENAEALLQVIARTLRDDGQSLREFMAHRSGHPYTRRSTHTAKTDATANAA